MKRALGFITLALAIFFSIFFNSCSKHIYQFDPNSAKYYPSPPDTARIQFLTSISTSSSIEKQRGGFARFLLGDLPVKRIVKPYGIASKPGKLYICDTQLGGIEIINFEERKFEYFIPTGKGKLSKPINCDIDEEGKLFVADWKRKQVIVFDEDGKFFQEIGGNADFKPTDVAVYKSILFVNDLNNHKVVAFDKKTYSKLYSFPHSEVGDDDYIYSATNICLDDSIVYVSDLGDSKIKKYKHDGTFIGSFGSIGRNPGQFARIKGIDIDHINIMKW